MVPLVMRWVVEYYEVADTTQPAEEFEDSVRNNHEQISSASA
jgi:hypothetical protein